MNIWIRDKENMFCNLRMHASRCAHDMHVKRTRATAAEYELLFNTNMLGCICAFKTEALHVILL